MAHHYRYEATLTQNGDMDAAYIVFPYDLRKETGRGRMHVHARFDGIPYEGSIVNMDLRDATGAICYIIGVPKAIRQKIGKTFGERISVEIDMATDKQAS